MKPNILLLDESFSALDYQTRLNILNDVNNIIKDEQITCIMVTHDLSEALMMSSKIIVLSNRPSKINIIHNIDIDKNKSIFDKRKDEKYMKYFDILWSELNE